MSTVYEAAVRPAHSGFGMYEKLEASAQENMESIDDWLVNAAEFGFSVRVAEEVSGRLCGQNGATVFAYAPYLPNGEPDTEAEAFCAVWVE